VPAIERDGAHVHYDVTGQGPPLLLGHSLLCDGRMWEDVVPALSRRFRVYNIDARGHGRSTFRDDEFTLEDLAEDWLAILDAEKIERALLCGLSMGGMTAMRLALARPERVAALALLDTSADPERAVERILYLVLAEVQRATGVRPLAPVIERKFFGRTTRRERRDVVERGMERILERDARAFYPATQAVFRRNGIVERLREIRCPTLVLVGEEDVATPLSRASRIAQGVAGAELVVIPRAGHMAPMEQPAAVEQALLSFFDRHAEKAAAA
jgi:3-oxoadipate enol-lactonase